MPAFLCAPRQEGMPCQGQSWAWCYSTLRIAVLQVGSAEKRSEALLLGHRRERNARLLDAEETWEKFHDGEVQVEPLGSSLSDDDARGRTWLEAGLQMPVLQTPPPESSS